MLLISALAILIWLFYYFKNSLKIKGKPVVLIYLKLKIYKICFSQNFFKIQYVLLPKKIMQYR